MINDPYVREAVYNFTDNDSFAASKKESIEKEKKFIKETMGQISSFSINKIKPIFSALRGIIANPADKTFYQNFGVSVVYNSFFNFASIDAIDSFLKAPKKNLPRQEALFSPRIESLGSTDKLGDLTTRYDTSNVILSQTLSLREISPEKLDFTGQLPSLENNQVTHLELSGCTLSSADWLNLISRLPNLKSLALYNTALPLDPPLIAALKEKNIESLHLSGVGDDGVALKTMLDEAVLDNLTELEIYNEPNFTKENWKALSNRLPHNLQSFEIGNCFIQGDVGTLLGTKLGERPIRHFSLEGGLAHDFEPKLKRDQSVIACYGYLALWHAFGQTELKYLESIYISNRIPTGRKEHNLTVQILNKCIQHGHILPARQIGWEGELNGLHVATWQKACMVVHCQNLLKTLSKKEEDSLPLRSWRSYSTLVEEINKLKNPKLSSKM